MAINLVKDLVVAVVQNTKATCCGKSASDTKEKRAAKKLLQELLGRVPTAQEVEDVLAV